MKNFSSELPEAEKCVEPFNADIGSLPKRLSLFGKGAPQR